MTGGPTHFELADKLIRFTREVYQTDAFIPLHAPLFLGSEKSRVSEAVASGFVSSVGHSVTEFEERLCQYTGAQHCVATVNGTAALHVALRVAGVELGDEVITQSLTFVATCNAIRYCGARPVFVDINPSRGGMCPVSLQQFLSDSTHRGPDGELRNRHTGRVIKACVPMHNIGHPVEIDRIQAICREHQLSLVEDSAESLGSFYQGIHTGRYGNLGIFSFNGNKIITTGGGGAIVTDNEALASQARHLSTTAKRPHPYLYHHDELGYNYRMPALNAALGCAQLDALPHYVENKRRLAGQYAAFFDKQGYAFMAEPEGSRSNYWFNSFLAKDLNERNHILETLNGNEVMARPAWTPMHTLELYRDCHRTDLPNTEWLEERLVSVPSSVVPQWL